MNGHLFCPVCYTNIIRTPADKLFFANGRRACFAHLHKFKHIRCDLRSTRPEGKRYLNEEEAQQAIADQQLAIVTGFRSSPPATMDGGPKEYDQTHAEDADGPIVEASIGRHRGDVFRLPSRISTITSICRDFETNLYRYYLLPGFSLPRRLIHLLTGIATVDHADDVPRLYYGRIDKSFITTRIPRQSSIRMTKLHCHPDVADFYLKDIDIVQREKGITYESVGRIVIFWGRITKSGVGLSVADLGWGEYALLPEKYRGLLAPDSDA